MSIKNFTDEQLLLELVSRNKGAESPRKVTHASPHTEFVIGIGCDHSVSINIDDESLRELSAGTFNRVDEGLSFGAAINAMKEGKKVARKGWNGRGMWCIYNPGSKGETHSMFDGSVYKNHGVDECEILPHFDMYTVNSEGRRAMLPGWLASQSDIDANDWLVVE